MSITTELVLDVKATLGEGAIWDARRQVLYWIDILESLLHIYDPATGEARALDVGQYVGTVVPRRAGDVMLAVRDGFARFHLDTQELVIVVDPEAHLPDNRFNDGKCDPAGRFWAGTMALDGVTQGAGNLWRLDPDYSVHHMLGGVTISNGIVWSHDRKTMYYIDTPTGEVWAFDYDDESGAIANRRTVVTFAGGQGSPDGMTIDADGMLWVAHWGGSRVSRWNPDSGEQLEVVHVPATQVTSCAFGGPNLDQLYITTARTGLDEKALATHPHAGGLFVARPGVRGVAAYEFAG